MPIQIPNDLPAAGILQQENIFVMRKTRAETQHIRPSGNRAVESHANENRHGDPSSAVCWAIRPCRCIWS